MHIGKLELSLNVNASFTIRQVFLCRLLPGIHLSRRLRRRHLLTLAATSAPTLSSDMHDMQGPSELSHCRLRATYHAELPAGPRR